MDEYFAPAFVAPGDEPFTLSHEGGEHEAFEDLTWQVTTVHAGVHYADLRTQHDHVELQTEHWTLQMDQLIDAYLHYHHQDTGDGLPAPEEYEVDTQCLTDVELVDLFSKYIVHT
ncbi:hypothetical protein J3A83DRAFT_4087894 [Scleroderma citrinum]